MGKAQSYHHAKFDIISIVFEKIADIKVFATYTQLAGLPYTDNYTDITKSSSASGLSPTLPQDSGMPSLRHWENLSQTQDTLVFNPVIAPSSIFCLVLCLCFLLFIIWQRDRRSMGHEYGFSMDVQALYKLTIVVIISLVGGSPLYAIVLRE